MKYRIVISSVIAAVAAALAVTRLSVSHELLPAIAVAAAIGLVSAGVTSLVMRAAGKD